MYLWLMVVSYSGIILVLYLLNNTYMFGVAGGPTAKSGVLLFSVSRI